MNCNSLEKVEEFLTNPVSLDEMVKLIPGWLQLNSCADFSILYMSPSWRKYAGFTEEDIEKFGHKIIERTVHPETTKRVVPLLLKLIEEQDYSKIITYFQYIKRPEGKQYNWYISNSKLCEELNCIISITTPVDIFKDSKEKIKNILDERLYLKDNLKNFAKITDREKEIINLFANGRSIKQVAEHLCISELTVKKHRQNIYFKLGFNKIHQLIEFSHIFDIS